jgi:hypothetical protein
VAQPKPRNEVHPSVWGVGCWRIYIGGNAWTAERDTLSTSEAFKSAGLFDHGSDVDSLLDFLSTLFPTSSAIAERPTCSRQEFLYGKPPTPLE